MMIRCCCCGKTSCSFFKKNHRPGHQPPRERDRARDHPPDREHPRLHHLRAGRAGERGVLQAQKGPGQEEEDQVRNKKGLYNSWV